MKYSLVLKKKQILIYVKTWRKLGNVMVSEIKDKNVLLFQVALGYHINLLFDLDSQIIKTM